MKQQMLSSFEDTYAPSCLACSSEFLLYATFPAGLGIERFQPRVTPYTTDYSTVSFGDCQGK